MAQLNGFSARDGIGQIVSDGPYLMSPTASGLLWYLVYSGIYDPGSPWFSFVNPKKTSMAMLCGALGGRSERAIQTAMRELEILGFIVRHPRFSSSGSQVANAIELGTPGDWCFKCRARGHGTEDDTPHILRGPPAETAGLSSIEEG